MKNSTNSTEQQPYPDPLDIGRKAVPSTSALQQRIILTSRNLLQEVGTNNRGEAKVSGSISKYLSKWLTLKPLAVSIAAGILVLTAGSAIWLSTPASFTITAPSQSLAVQEINQAMDELAWEDLLLLQDELAFAQL